jgi:hypothetical protein
VYSAFSPNVPPKSDSSEWPMAAVSTPCMRSIHLPAVLLDPEDTTELSFSILCGCVTDKHKIHRESAWCSADKTELGKEYLLGE